MSFGEPGDRVSASRRRLNEAREQDGLFSPPLKGCINGGERYDRRSCSEEKNSSGKEVEGGGMQHLVKSPSCDAGTLLLSDDKLPFVRRPTPPDGGRGEGGGGWHANNTRHCEKSKLDSADDMREDGRNASKSALYCEGSKIGADDRRIASNGKSTSIGSQESSSSSCCVLEEGGKNRAFAGGTSRNDDRVVTDVFVDDDAKGKSLRLRVAGEFVGNVINECSSAAAWSTSMPLK